MMYMLSAAPFRLEFKHAFHIAHGNRTSTDTVFATIALENLTGYGEAALPPYLGYAAEKVVAEINYYQLLPLPIPELLVQLHSSKLSRPAKAAIDIALHDLWGKQQNLPLHQLLQMPLQKEKICFYTLGISTIEELEKKLAETPTIKIYKIKLGGEADHEFLKEFRKRSSLPFCADANQSWTTKEKAIEEINRLYELGCLFIEQPLPTDHPDQHTVFKQSKLPLFLDESIQSSESIIANASNCHGINVKLVKSGGIQPAVAWIKLAQSLNLKILIGCMSESSCGTAAALQLCSASEYADLDGPLLIGNDPFQGLNYVNGDLFATSAAGIGIHRQ